MKKRVLIISSLILLIWVISFLWFYFFNKEYFVKKDLDNYMTNLISHNCENIDKKFYCDTDIQTLNYKILAISYKQGQFYITILTNTLYIREEGFKKEEIPYNLLMENLNNHWSVAKVDNIINRYFESNKNKK